MTLQNYELLNYNNGKNSDGKMILQINELQVFIIEKIYRDYLNGIPILSFITRLKNLVSTHIGQCYISGTQ